MRVVRLLIAVVVAAGPAACADSTDPGNIPASIEIVDGDGQEAVHTQALPDSLRVRVKDRDGTPLAGVLVDWTASSGAISPSPSTTDASGAAAARWVFYRPETGWSSVGTHHATATVAGAGSVTFTSHAKEGVVLRSVSITPDRVNVFSGPASAIITVHATDDRTGLGLIYGSVTFYNPTETQTVFETLHDPLELVSGTPADGIWEATIVVPQGAETGAWTLGRLTLGWGCGPSRRMELFSTALQSLGMPYELTVTAEPEAPVVLRAGRAPQDTSTPATPARTAARSIAALC